MCKNVILRENNINKSQVWAVTNTTPPPTVKADFNPLISRPHIPKSNPLFLLDRISKSATEIHEPLWFENSLFPREGAHHGKGQWCNAVISAVGSSKLLSAQDLSLYSQPLKAIFFNWPLVSTFFCRQTLSLHLFAGRPCSSTATYLIMMMLTFHFFVI